MIDKVLYEKLQSAGTTKPAENIPSLYKIGMGLDSESTTITHTEIKGKRKKRQITVVDNCFCYAWQFAFNKDNAVIVRTIEHIMNVLIDIVDTVKALNERTENNAIFIIWCANLSHEWSFLKAEICNYFEITKAFAKSPRDVLYIQLENCVELRECIGLFGVSLDDIAKKWCNENNQKLTGTFDYNLIRTWETELTETEIAYMKHDVTTLAEMHENVIKAYTQPNGVCRLPYTSSGFVRLDLKDSIRNDEDLTELRDIWNSAKRHKNIDTNIEYLKKINQRCVTDLFQWTICRDYGYTGGLCGSNIKTAGLILNDVICADLTSDYPAQLTHKKYPTGSLKQITAGNLTDIMNKLIKDHKPFFALLKINKMQAKTQHATFSKHKIINNANTGLMSSHGTPKNLIIYNGKVFKGENIIVCWNDVDIKAYKELYKIKAAVITLWVFDRYATLPQWFLKPLWYYYGKKAELKNSGIKSGIEYDSSKRFVNSIYGVCATRVNDSYDTLDTDYNFKVGKEKDFDNIRKNFWLNPYIAFWCTSYARSVLMHFIARFPDCIVQYDTDSLYYIKSKSAELEKALSEYNNKIANQNHRIFRDFENPLLYETLGQWDFDDLYKKFLGMGAKKYIKQDETGDIYTVIAGLPKKAIPKEIKDKQVKEPFSYYNPLYKWIVESDNSIIIEHIFAYKFASVYDDSTECKYVEITDYTGKTALQKTGCYHAIIPIDFTLSMAKEYIDEIMKGRK